MLCCPLCQTILGREVTYWLDPVLWCGFCQKGYLPGTDRFDWLLSHQTPSETQYLFRAWDENSVSKNAV